MQFLAGLLQIVSKLVKNYDGFGTGCDTNTDGKYFLQIFPILAELLDLNLNQPRSVGISDDSIQC